MIVKFIVLISCFQWTTSSSSKDGTASFDSMSKIINTIKGEIYPNYRTEIVLIGDVGFMKSEHFQGNGDFIQLSNLENRESVKPVIQRGFSAIVISRLLKDVSVDDLFDVMEYQANSLAVLIGSNNQDLDFCWNPKEKEKHLIYIKQTRYNHYLFYIFCGGHHDREPQLINVWRHGGFQYAFKKLNTICPHALSQRKLAISVTYLPPAVRRNPTTGKWSGPEVSIMNHLADKFGFSYELRMADFTFARHGNQRYAQENTSYHLLNTWQVTLSMGVRGITYETYKAVDFLTPLTSFDMVYVTRIPVEQQTLAKLFQPFNSTIWTSVYVTLLLLSLTFATTYKIYSRIEEFREVLLKRLKVPWFDFLILPFAKFVEPDPLPWFKSWSTGKMLILLWSFYTMLIMFFYTCNLRAHLMKDNLEERVDTSEDVLARGTRVYTLEVDIKFDYKSPFAGAFLTSQQRAISKRSYETNGRIKPQHGIFPDYVKESILKDGSIARLPFGILLYDELLSRRVKTKGLNTFYYSAEADSYYFSFSLRKCSPYRKDLDLVLSQLRDMGFYPKYQYDPIPLTSRRKWTPRDSNPLETPLVLYKIALIFFLLCIGLLFSSIVFTLELRTRHVTYPNIQQNSTMETTEKYRLFYSRY